MRRICSIAAIVLIAAVSPAAAQEDEAPAAEHVETAAAAEIEIAGDAAPQTAAAPKDEKMVCRTERVTGSLTRRKRTCMTQAEWAELERRTYQGMNDFTRGAAGGACVPNDPMSGGRC